MQHSQLRCLPRIIAVLAALAGSACSAAEPAEAPPDRQRSAYLDDLILPHTYAPGKNSFIVWNPAKGQKVTLLNLVGSGAVRHFWTTWSTQASQISGDPAGQVLLRVYRDDNATPILAGPLDTLFREAEGNTEAGVPLPAFIFNRSYNLYVPIEFKSSLRIEAEPTVDLRELYMQIDYRLTPPTAPAVAQTPPSPRTRHHAEIPTGDDGLIIRGPAILRQLAFAGEQLDDVELLIYWDDATSPGVQAPLKYFFGGFNNAAMESAPGRLTTWFPMPFRQQARLVLRGGAARKVSITYDADEQPALPEGVRYFHALYRETPATVGYEPHLAVQTQGAGHFVGVNLFDTGHNHGGGDLALLDAGTEWPRVLHGICGEDYFGFAWHDTGRMTPLSGAPVHERRYRLHLENPYPFVESLRFSFGTFAGLHPRSVAFWYQSPASPKPGEWRALDVPWNVLGPLPIGATPPTQPDGQPLKSEVMFGGPVPIEVQWQSVNMVHGFLDLTYHFRHYTLTKEGMGYVVGRGLLQLVTYVYADQERTLEARIGHDDAARICVNGRMAANLQAGEGFRAAAVMLPLRKGWNELTLTLENDENVNWRWCGTSMSVKTPGAIRFALKPE